MILISKVSEASARYTKTTEGKWLLTEYESENAVLALESIAFKIAFSDLYERVNFAESEE